MTFGNRLKYILNFKKISQRDFAHSVSISESQLSKLLNNKKKPTVKEINKINKALSISYDCIIGNIELFDDMLEICGNSLW